MSPPPRLWSRENLELFVDYFCEAQIQDQYRVNLRTIANAIAQGVIVDVNDSVNGTEEQHAELKKQLKLCAYGEQEDRRQSVGRTAKLEKMIFKKAVLSTEHSLAATRVDKLGRLFRNTTELRTMNYAMDVYATMGKTIIDAGNEIAQLRVELAKKEQECERLVFSNFIKLFKSIAIGEQDSLVDALTLVKIIKGNREMQLKRQQPQKQGQFPDQAGTSNTMGTNASISSISNKDGENQNVNKQMMEGSPLSPLAPLNFSSQMSTSQIISAIIEENVELSRKIVSNARQR